MPKKLLCYTEKFSICVRFLLRSAVNAKICTNLGQDASDAAAIGEGPARAD
jgi:hypothetical protein